MPNIVGLNDQGSKFVNLRLKWSSRSISMDDQTALSERGGEEHAKAESGSRTTFDRSASYHGDDEFPGRNDFEQDGFGPDSSADSSGGGTSVREGLRCVDPAVGVALTTPSLRPTRQNWCQSLNPDEKVMESQQGGEGADDMSRNSEAVGSGRSDDTDQVLSKLITSEDHNSMGLFRAQSARENSRPHEHDVEGQNATGESLLRAKSFGIFMDQELQRGSRGWLSTLRSRMGSLEIKVERAFSTRSTLSRTSSVVPIPILSSVSGGQELSGEGSKEPEGGIERSATTNERGEAEDSEQSPIEQVALVVPTSDDPSIPYWTFRVAVLGILSCIVITFLNTYFSYRNEPITITLTTVLIATAPLGKFMASTLPDRFFRIPGTQRGFSLNPGPFTMKEHGLILIFASGGSIRPGGIFVFNLIKVFLHQHIGFVPGFLVTITCELFGYCWAVLLYKYFVEPAQFWWPASLVNVSLSQAVNVEEKRKGMSLIGFFIICFSVTCAYYVIPGLFIPSLSSISVVCYIFKHNVLAQQLGSGSHGLGLGSFSLDWATISSFNGSPMIIPWQAVANIAVGFVLQAYLVAPLTYWNNWFSSKNYPIFSLDIFTRSGKAYDVAKFVERTNSQLHRQAGSLSDREALPHFSAFYTMSIGFTFALFGAVCSHVLLFHGKDILRAFRPARRGRPGEPPDVHTRLMSKYPAIPFRWCALLFLGTHLAAIVNVVVYKDQLEMKWWGVLLGTAVTAVMTIPVCILVATSNQVPNLGIIPQYLMGFIRAGEPITNVMFRTYSTVVCGRTANYLGNFKLGHYMKIPPRATFFGQLVSTLVSSLVSTMVAAWLTGSIDNICDISKLPQNSPWTCPHDRVFYDQAVMFGIAGPHRLFTHAGAPYRTLNFYFIPGFLLPVLLWLLGIALPGKVWIGLISGPLIIKGATLMPPSPIVNNAMWIYVALFFSIYVFNYKKHWWKRYNYVLSAALDAGTVVMALMLYYSLDEGKKVLNWWGMRGNGDHCPLASCPTAPGKHHPGCPVF